MKKLFLYSLILLASFAFTFGIIGNAQATIICANGDVSGCMACLDGPVGEPHNPQKPLMVTSVIVLGRSWQRMKAGLPVAILVL